jgi:hypothetical protein
VIEGEVRDMKAVRAANGDRLIVVARNDTTVQVLRAPGGRLPSVARRR